MRVMSYSPPPRAWRATKRQCPVPGALRRRAPGTGHCLFVELLDVGIGDVILSATTRLERYAPSEPRLRRCGNKGQEIHCTEADSPKDQSCEQRGGTSHVVSARNTS